MSTNKITHFALRVWGDFACFTRPEMKVERVSYDVMTPSAARGILEAIYWKPQIRWHIDQIHVLAPIQFTNIRRNEIKSKIPVGTVRSTMKRKRGTLRFYVDDGDNRQQRATTLLRDVDYIIQAHFELLTHDAPPEKHSQMFRRRARKGQYFHHPYFGCREFPAHFELVENELPTSPRQGKQELGFMLHDIDYTPQPDGTCQMNPRYFRATLQNGILDIPSHNSQEILQ